MFANFLYGVFLKTLTQNNCLQWNYVFFTQFKAPKFIIRELNKQYIKSYSQFINHLLVFFKILLPIQSRKINLILADFMGRLRRAQVSRLASRGSREPVDSVRRRVERVWRRARIPSKVQGGGRSQRQCSSRMGRWDGENLQEKIYWAKVRSALFFILVQNIFVIGLNYRCTQGEGREIKLHFQKSYKTQK